MTHHSRSPHRDLQVQLDVESFLNPAAGQVDQAANVAGICARMDNDEIAVAVANFRSPDARFGQAGLLDKLAGAQAARIFENSSRLLKAERL